jgi:hypothetical protein
MSNLLSHSEKRTRVKECLKMGAEKVFGFKLNLRNEEIYLLWSSSDISKIIIEVPNEIG